MGRAQARPFNQTPSTQSHRATGNEATPATGQSAINRASGSPQTIANRLHFHRLSTVLREMSQSDPRRALDLSAIPEPFRSQILKRLAKLPDAQREKLLREGSPVVERLLASLSAASTRQQQEKRETAPVPESAADAESGRDVIGGKHPASIDTQRILAMKPLPTVMQGDSANHLGWLAVIGAALVGALAWAMYG